MSRRRRRIEEAGSRFTRPEDDPVARRGEVTVRVGERCASVRAEGWRFDGVAREEAAMDEIPEITVEQARERLAQGQAVFVDVRDPMSYEAAHIPGAIRVNDDNLEAFLASADKKRPLIVYCYHGFSSVGGAGYFLGEGFEDVVSMEGGFEAWRASDG
jgi:thiosulfate sulfurtransferase